MTTPGNGGGSRPVPPDSGLNVIAAVDEVDDQAYYYFAPFEAFSFRGDTAYRVAYFARTGTDHALVDIRDPGSIEGFAFVRSSKAPGTIAQEVDPAGETLPDGLIYVGRSILSNLTVRQRNEIRSTLGIRGQITNVKSILRFMLLTESGEAGKPGRLQPEPDGGLYVYLGDLRVDLTNG